MPGERGNQGREPPVFTTMARYAHLGLQLALATGLFLFAGWWADGRLGTTPLLTILGALMGAAAGFYSMIRQLLPGSRRSGTGDRPEEDD
jgi:F0F1-type ATP synthase assembly protein I